MTIQMRNNDEQCALRLLFWVGGPTLLVDGRSPPELSGALPQPVYAELTLTYLINQTLRSRILTGHAELS